jgi:hypothetical protein
MTKSILTLLGAVAFAGCMSDPQIADSQTAEANTTFLAQPAPDYDLAGAPAPYAPAPEAYVPQSPAPQLAKARGTSCNIIVQRTSNGVRLKGIADLGRAAYGDYSFVITKNGRSGSSDIDQGGPFEGRAGERIDLGASELSVGRGDGYRATLILTSGGREVCRRVVRS